jgi:hypothetical protein
LPHFRQHGGNIFHHLVFAHVDGRHIFDHTRVRPP